jgi:hypothetical protein
MHLSAVLVSPPQRRLRDRRDAASAPAPATSLQFPLPFSPFSHDGLWKTKSRWVLGPTRTHTLAAADWPTHVTGENSQRSHTANGPRLGTHLISWGPYVTRIGPGKQIANLVTVGLAWVGPRKRVSER